MKDRTGEVWMYEHLDAWAVAIVVAAPRCADGDEIQHSCIQLAGDERHFTGVGPTTWHEYENEWDTHEFFTRLA